MDEVCFGLVSRGCRVLTSAGCLPILDCKVNVELILQLICTCTGSFIDSRRTPRWICNGTLRTDGSRVERKNLTAVQPSLRLSRVDGDLA